jgi:drug/metabolite transporter (DMT)-like permease
VAVALALTFVTLRHNSHVPILLAVGSGAVLAGVTGTVLTGFPDMLNGRLWPIAFTGLVILPTSFFALTLASRYTSAANVSLLMLLETVLGPVWVWVGLGERPTIRMFLGGAIVVGALTLYLWYERHRAKQVARARI